MALIFLSSSSSSSSSSSLSLPFLLFIASLFISLSANNWLLLLSSIFFNLFKIPSFLSDLSNPSINTLPYGEYSNFTCSNAFGL